MPSLVVTVTVTKFRPGLVTFTSMRSMAMRVKTPVCSAVSCGVPFLLVPIRNQQAVDLAITDASGRTLSGQTAEAFYNSIRHARPIAVATTGFSVFDAMGPVPHRLYLGHAELFKLSGSAEIVLSFVHAGHLPDWAFRRPERP